MAIIQMLPPPNGLRNSISFDGRTYASIPGVAIPVPDFDVAVLQANGWTSLPINANLISTTVTDTGGVPDITHFKATASPASSSTAVYDAVQGDLVYPAGAAAVGGGGHFVGALGHFSNVNTTNTVPLAIGIEGKIDNIAGATITNAICTESNLGSNAGTISNLFFHNADLTSNSGTIGLVAAVALSLNGNSGTIPDCAAIYVPSGALPGTITRLYGLYFANQTGAGIGTKHCIYCLDPNADINTVGPIITTGKTTTATFQLDTGTKTATATAGAATLNKASGKITTEALTTAAGASYTLTLTNSAIAAADTVFASVANGTNSAGLPVAGLVSAGAGSATITVNNMHASAALNGTLVISFMSMKA